MKLSATRLFPLALVAALALLSFWLEQAGRVDAPHPSLRRHDPDYVIDNLLIQNFDAAGRAVSTLSAAKMVHYPDDDSTELALPRVVDQKLNKPRMTLRADRGTMNQAGDEVFLYDNVLLVREDNRSIVGRGLEYDNETRETRMYSDVRARFEPKKAP
jgi:lipopolysaccharide export system protein LptC